MHRLVNCTVYSRKSEQHCESPYHGAIRFHSWGNSDSVRNSSILEVPYAQPHESPYHGAIHWTPSKCNSKIFEHPAESSGDSNAKIFELHCEPTEPPHELPSVPYRVRLEYMKASADNKSLKNESKQNLVSIYIH